MKRSEALGVRSIRTAVLMLRIVAVASCLAIALGLCGLVLGLTGHFGSPWMGILSGGALVFGIVHLRDALRRLGLAKNALFRAAHVDPTAKPGPEREGDIAAIRGLALDRLHRLAKGYATASALGAMLCLIGLGAVWLTNSDLARLCAVMGGSGAIGCCALWWIAKGQLSKVREQSGAMPVSSRNPRDI